MILILLKIMNKDQTSKLEFLFFLFIQIPLSLSLTFSFQYICRVYFFKLFSLLIIYHPFFVLFLYSGYFYFLLSLVCPRLVDLLLLLLLFIQPNKHRTVFRFFPAFDRVNTLMNLMNSLFYL